MARKITTDTAARDERAAIALTPAVLTAWRERLGYSQHKAADALGCSRGAWRGWESGEKRVPKYIGLAMAALALGISPFEDNSK